jgi:hypothetical protein
MEVSFGGQKILRLRSITIFPEKEEVHLECLRWDAQGLRVGDLGILRTSASEWRPAIAILTTVSWNAAVDGPKLTVFTFERIR